MAITVTVGAAGKVDNCLFDDNLMSSKVSALTIGALGVVSNTKWFAGAATSTITLGLDSVIDASHVSVFDSLVMSGARAAIRDSILYFQNAGDAVLSGDGASIQDTTITTVQTSGTEAVLLSGNNTQVDSVLFDIQTTQTTDLYDAVRVTGDHAQVAIRLQQLNGARKWRYAVTIDAGALGTRLGQISVDDVNLLASGVISDSGEDTIRMDHAFFNGTFVEHMATVVTEAAGVVTMSLEKTGGGQLTMAFSDGHTQLDTAPALTIALTVGSDASPTTNYIYIPQATKVLTKSTTGFPTSGGHIKVAFFLVPSAAFVASDGLYVHQQWNDEDAHTDGQGHLSSMTERMRRHQAIWFSGLAGAGVDDYLTIVAGTIDLKIASGVGYQLHRHTIAAFDTSAGDVALVKNWSGDAYHNITNLFDIVADSAGVAIGNNKYFNLVVWSVTNSVGYNPVFINLPSGTYTSQVDAENDVDGMDDFTIPREFSVESSTGLLVCRLTVQNKNTTWEYKSTTDLRGTTPQTASGGAAGITTEFADNQFAVFNVTDTTKILELDVSAITTGTTRTWTVPDASGTVTIDGLLLSGGTMSGAITMGGFSIVNAGDIEVDSVTPASADISFFKADGTTVSVLWDESDDRWEFSTGVTISGTVGIGTATPANLLTVWHSTASVIEIHSNRELAGDLAALVFSTVGHATSYKKGAIFFQADGGGYGQGDLVFALNKSNTSTNTGVADQRFVLINTGDIQFYKVDSSTVSLLWDESDNRWEFNTEVTISGDLGVGVANPLARLHIDQSSTTAALPVLTLDQADVSEEMIEFVTTIGTGNAIEAVGAKALTTTHFIKVTLPGGLTRYIPAGTIA